MLLAAILLAAFLWHSPQTHCHPQAAVDIAPAGETWHGAPLLIDGAKVSLVCNY